MSSNKQPDPLQSLYLRQFFGHYFQRKDMLEILSSFSNGLKVLESIIQQFEHTRGVKTIPTFKKNSQLETACSGDIERESRSINEALESIYNRLQSLFDGGSLKKEPEVDLSFRSGRSGSILNEEDDELYEMLNKYKNDFRREKEERGRGQQQISRLHTQVQSLADEVRGLREELRSSTLSCEQFKKENTVTEEELAILREDNCQLQSRVQECGEVEAQLGLLKADYQLLTLHYVESQQKQTLLAEKFKAIDGIVQSKIQQNESKWKLLIAERLAAVDIYEKPTCKVFRDFVQAVNKENCPQNTK